jgi:hypothetical protein
MEGDPFQFNLHPSRSSCKNRERYLSIIPFGPFSTYLDFAPYVQPLDLELIVIFFNNKNRVSTKEVLILHNPPCFQ